MSFSVDALAHTITLGVLVGIFVSLWRTNRSPRFQLWVLGWVLVLLHFVTELPAWPPPLERLATTVQFATLGISCLAFLLSFSAFVDLPRWRCSVLAAIGAPIALLSVFLGYELHFPLAQSVVGVVTYAVSVAVIVIWHRRFSWYAVALCIFTVGLGALAVLRLMAGDSLGGYYYVLLALCAGSCVLTLRTYRRASPGVVCVAMGFASWAGVFMLRLHAPWLLAEIGAESDLWNVPKLVVAFGMIVTILEGSSRDALDAEANERHLSRQMTRFADLTSRFLRGAAVDDLCTEIAQAITEVSNFDRAAIVLADDAGRLYIAGHSGLTPDIEAQLKEVIASTRIADLEAFCARARNVGKNVYICPADALGELKRVPSTRKYPEHPNWRDGDEMLVALRSSAGNIVGCISLDDPKDVNRVTAAHMSALEMLASDIGVAIERVSMQRKVMLHEKLASIGQLVGGVAHELNNPLTVLMGYTELMSDADTQRRFERELSTMRREALRMRGIIDSLLRFARQSRVETRAASLLQAVEHALQLSAYELQRKNVEVIRDLPQELPPVQMDEAQLKTVLMNLISNAADAMQASEKKRLSIYARRTGDRVLVSMVDTGKGFDDVTRAFDPFFSTKGFGRGTGLGLSVCYGIVKQHGGDIYAQNVSPAGACVTMELAVAPATVSAHQAAGV